MTRKEYRKHVHCELNGDYKQSLKRMVAIEALMKINMLFF